MGYLKLGGGGGGGGGGGVQMDPLDPPLPPKQGKVSSYSLLVSSVFGIAGVFFIN